MKTRVLKPDEAALREAASILKSGGLVGFPTETVYGLGANALNPDAVRAVFAAKGRPADNPLILHIANPSDLRPLIACEPPPSAKILMEKFWPGPLTMIFPKSEIVPSVTTGGLDSAAIRMPSHPVARRLIELTGLPIAAPSGNRSGRPSPTAAAHMLEDMDGRVEMILDGGSCGVGVESTVLDMTGDVPRVLRPGGVTPEEIRAAVGACTVDPAVLRPLGKDEKAKSPGMKYRHYAPVGALTVFHGRPDAVADAIRKAYDEALQSGKSPLILALTDHLSRYGDRRTEPLGHDAAEMAQTVFAALRDADAKHADVIFSEAVETEGIGLAVMNRLGRAAAFHIIEV